MRTFFSDNKKLGLSNKIRKNFIKSKNWSRHKHAFISSTDHIAPKLLQLHEKEEYQLTPLSTKIAKFYHAALILIQKFEALMC